VLVLSLYHDELFFPLGQFFAVWDSSDLNCQIWNYSDIARISRKPGLCSLPLVALAIIATAKKYIDIYFHNAPLRTIKLNNDHYGPFQPYEHG